MWDYLIEKPLVYMRPYLMGLLPLKQGQPRPPALLPISAPKEDLFTLPYVTVPAPAATDQPVQMDRGVYPDSHDYTDSTWSLPYT